VKCRRDSLKAKAIIKQDTKGFKPDWADGNSPKYYANWDLYRERLDWMRVYVVKEPHIYFESREALEESFKKHPEEWKTYLTYEQ